MECSISMDDHSLPSGVPKVKFVIDHVNTEKMGNLNQDSFRNDEASLDSFSPRKKNV